MRIAPSRRTLRRACLGIAGASVLTALAVAAQAQSNAPPALQLPVTASSTPMPAMAPAALPAPIGVADAKTIPTVAAPASPAAPTLAVADAPVLPAAPIASPLAASARLPALTPLSATAPLSALPSLVSSAAAAEDDGTDRSQIARDTAMNEKHITDAAHAMVKHLDTSSDAMTLQDLNSARQTVARLEAIIEVEKKLAEIDKIRGERNNEKKDSKALANAIPASALAPLPTSAFAARRPMGPAQPMVTASRMPAPTPVVKEKPKLISANMEIVRISGSDGKYTATLRTPDGQTKSVRDGDHIADGVTVRWISSTGVGLEEEGSTHTIHIHNVDTIFSAMR